MNKLITKLALDAGMLKYTDTKHCFIPNQANLENLEKYTIMVVNECLNAIKYTKTQWPYASEDYCKNINQRFEL